MSANDILMGSSVPAAKFANPGDSYRGFVVREPTASQQRKYNPGGVGELDFWEKSGQPKMQAIIDIQTDQRDPMVDGDDGIRRLYVKDHGAPYAKGSGRIRDAVRDAVLAAGAKGVEVGGWLEVTYTGAGVGKGATPPKLFRVTYRPPSQQEQPATVAGGQPTQQWAQQPQTAYTSQQPQTQTYGTPAASILGAMQGHAAQAQQPPF